MPFTLNAPKRTALRVAVQNLINTEILAKKPSDMGDDRYAGESEKHEFDIQNPLSHTKKIIFRRYTNLDDNRPRTRDFINRLNSIIDAGSRLSGTSLESLKEKHHGQIYKIFNDFAMERDRKQDKNDIQYFRRRKKYVKKAKKQFFNYVSEYVFPEVVASFIKENESYQDALKRLYHQEIEIVNETKRTILMNVFPVVHENSETNCFDIQIPIGYFTQEQQTRLSLSVVTPDTHPGVLRDQEGLSGFILQASGRIEEGKYIVDDVFFRHASPVVIKEQNPSKRLTMTTRNATQIAENIVGLLNRADPNLLHSPAEVDICEIRLLSVIKKFLPDSEQQQYLQILETFFALEMQRDQYISSGRVNVMPHFSIVSLGVNQARKKILSDHLRAWINSRAFNEFFEKIFQSIPADSKLQELLKPIIYVQREKISGKLLDTHIKGGRKRLITFFHDLNIFLNRYEIFYEKLLIETDKEQKQYYQRQLSVYEDIIHEKKVDLFVLLKDHHTFEKQRYELIRAAWHRQKSKIMQASAQLNDDEKKLLDTIERFNGLLYGEDSWFIQRGSQYYKNEYNYWLQVILAQMNNALDIMTASGCNDDKDRGGRFAETREAHELFFQLYGRYPHYKNENDVKVFQQMIASFHQYSVQVFHAEMTSLPGSRGIKVFKSDGNEFLNRENRPMGELAKGVYDKAKDKTKEVKKIKKLRTNVQESKVEEKPLIIIGKSEPNPQRIIDDFCKYHLHALLMSNKKLSYHVSNVCSSVLIENTFKAKVWDEYKNYYLDDMVKEIIEKNKFDEISHLIKEKKITLTKDETAMLDRVIKINKIENRVDASLNTQKWKNDSFNGIQFQLFNYTFKFFEIKRSKVTQNIDYWINCYDKSNETDKTPILKNLLIALKEWNEWHVANRTRSYRRAAVESLTQAVACRV